MLRRLALPLALLALTLPVALPPATAACTPPPATGFGSCQWWLEWYKKQVETQAGALQKEEQAHLTFLQECVTDVPIGADKCVLRWYDMASKSAINRGNQVAALTLVLLTVVAPTPPLP